MKILKTVKVPVSALAFVFAGSVQAQIPVTDGVSISTSIKNQVETIVKWGEQFKLLQEQIDQYKKQYESITGSRGMGSLLDNTALNAPLSDDWQKALADVKKTSAYATERSKYPTLDGMPKTNAMYDIVASQNTVMSDLYSKASKRLGLIQSLTAQIDSANDPAAKVDLTNRLISEQNAIQANQHLVTILQVKQKQDMEVASQAAVKEFTCKEFNRTNC
ncbi:type IV secretion system protein [Verminephrobacter aporrectodeae]|nr:type IV secretion system protein [Verminephrobacter aporrectodeae]